MSSCEMQTDSVRNLYLGTMWAAFGVPGWLFAFSGFLQYKGHLYEKTSENTKIKQLVFTSASYKLLNFEF